MKIICIGRNYIDHAKELNNPVPKKPLVFLKPDSAILKKGMPFFIPDFSKDVHYEGELVLRINRLGRHIDPAYAHTYFNEITVGIDFTARDLQKKCKEKGHPWEIAKAFDGSAPVGKFIPLPENWETNGLTYSLNKNGETVQIGKTEDLIFDFRHLIAYISKFFTLKIGDLIFTGTPAGVGPVSIGDHLEGFIGDQSVLEVRVR